MKLRPVTKIFIIFIGFLIFVRLTSYLTNREKPFADSDLEAVRTSVPAEQNTFHLLKDIQPGLYEPIDIGDSFCLLIRQHYSVVEKRQLERRIEAISAASSGTGYYRGGGPGMGPGMGPGGYPRRGQVYRGRGRRGGGPSGFSKPRFDSIYRSILSEIECNDYFDEQLISQILEKNKAALECFDTIIAGRYFQAPSLNGPYYSLYCVLELVELRANYLFQTGKEPEAFEEAMKVIKSGHMLENCEEKLRHHQIGSTAKLMGIELLHRLVSKASVDPSLMTQYIDRLSQFYVDLDKLADVLRHEYQVAKYTINDLASDKDSLYKWLDKTEQIAYTINRGGTFMPEETKRLLGLEVRALIKGLGKPYSSRSWYVSGSPGIWYGRGMDVWERIQFYRRKNFIGRQLYDHFRKDPSDIVSNRCLEDAAVSMMRGLVALRGYKKKHGKLPESLGELVPEFIEEVPTDPFDGNPVRYSKTNKLVYSIGRDLVDTDGVDTSTSGHRGRYVRNREFRNLQEPAFKIQF